MAASDRIHGACNCGAISISIKAASFPKASSMCHCLNCRASGGSLFALNLPTPTKAIEVVGKTKIWVDTAESGNHSNRHFCGDCGSPIMTIVSETPEKAFVKGGLFRNFGVDLPRPVLQLFMRRRETWETGIEGIKTLD